MEGLYIISGRSLEPNPNMLLIYPFSKIWERDTSPLKFTALREFAYITFMASMGVDNPYKSYDPILRRLKVKEDLFTKEGTLWEEDNIVLEGIEKIESFQQEASASYAYYMSALNAAGKLRDFFDDFSMTTLNPKTGLPLYKPKEITSALIETEKVLQTLASIKKKVEEEIYQASRIKSDKKTSKYAEQGQKPERKYMGT